MSDRGQARPKALRHTARTRADWPGRGHAAGHGQRTYHLVSLSLFDDEFISLTHLVALIFVKFHVTVSEHSRSLSVPIISTHSNQELVYVVLDLSHRPSTDNEGIKRERTAS